MNKETIEIERYKEITPYYSETFPHLKENSPKILDKLVEWSNNYIMPFENGKLKCLQEKPIIYTHILRCKKEGLDKIPLRKLGEKITGEDYYDEVCYLDIYYQ